MVAPPQFGPKSVVAAIEAIKQGKLVVVTDDESRENEGDLIMAAEFATPANVGFIVRYTSGVICCAVCCCPPTHSLASVVPAAMRHLALLHR